MNDLGKISFRFCGTYDSNRTYEEKDVVAYEGSTYCALSITTGNLPTNENYWFLMAAGSSGSGIVISETEPNEQKGGEIWMQPYLI